MTDEHMIPTPAERAEWLRFYTQYRPTPDDQPEMVERIKPATPQSPSASRR